jgi:ferric-dicitrate binding protein FerR (iron transport regulator)
MMNETRWDELTVLLHTGQISAADFAELEAALRDSPSARKAFHRACRLDANLRRHAENAKALPKIEAVSVPVSRRRWVIVAGFAAAAVIVIAAVVFWRSSPQADLAIRVLATEGVGSLDMRSLNAGQWIELEGGIIELALGNKSRVVIEGPAKFAIPSVQHIRLERGRCYAEMEKGSFGLRIETPSGEVLDLGTALGVEVKSAIETAVHVFEGAVEVGNPGERSRLAEGKGILWLRSGKMEPIEDSEERFLHRLPAHQNRAISWLHWSFDEPEGDNVETTGEGFDPELGKGRIHGATRVKGVFGQGIEFNGVDEWVETSFPGIGGDHARTVACWVRLNADFGEENGQAIVGWGEFSLANRNLSKRAAWELAIRDAKSAPEGMGRIKVGFGGPMTVGSTDLRDGKWHHVAAVFTGPSGAKSLGSVLVYVDGQLERRTFGVGHVQLKTDTATSKAELVQFGRQVLLVSRQREYFKGAIDEVFIVDSALTGNEIRRLMKNNSMSQQP